MAIDSAEIGRRIKKAREARGWTQLAFAQEAGVSPSTVQRWEGGGLPPIRELIRIAAVLGIATDDLVESEEPAEETRFRRIVQEELQDVVAAVARIQTLLEEPPRERKAKP